MSLGTSFKLSYSQLNTPLQTQALAYGSFGMTSTDEAKPKRIGRVWPLICHQVEPLGMIVGDCTAAFRCCKGFQSNYSGNQTWQWNISQS